MTGWLLYHVGGQQDSLMASMLSLLQNDLALRTFGRRLLQLKRPDEAVGMFRTAAQDAGDDPLLRELAEAELQKLALPGAVPQ